MKHPFERPGIGKSAAAIAPTRYESLTIRSWMKPIAMRVPLSLLEAMLTIGLSLATPALADNFFFSTGNTDAKLGALSRRPSAGKIETETADDFLLTETTVIRQATIVGLVPPGTPLSNISNVEVEVYHVFPGDSANPPSGNVPTRVNSPADVEIDEATRDGFVGNLRFTASVLQASLSVGNSVLNGINKKPNQTTLGEGAKTGEVVEIRITFTRPIVLPAGHYFFRPEVLVTGGDFLYLSAPKPIVSPPGTVFAGDLQAWIRNSNLTPDWLRIGTDIIGGATPPTFNMTFSLTGETIPEAGSPGQANCQGKTVTALAHQFGGIDAAAAGLGFDSVSTLQVDVEVFCAP